MPNLYKEIEGWFTYAPLYDYVVEKYPNGKFLEIGCWYGRSGVYLLEKIYETKSNIFVYFVDTFKGEEGVDYQKEKFKQYGENFLIEEFTKNVNKVPGKNRAIWQMDSLKAAELFADNEFDFIFVDGWHAQCYEDMVAYYPKVKPGGTFAGHDIKGDLVREAVDRFEKDFNMKVHRVVDEREYWIIEK